MEKNWGFDFGNDKLDLLVKSAYNQVTGKNIISVFAACTCPPTEQMQFVNSSNWDKPTALRHLLSKVEEEDHPRNGPARARGRRDIEKLDLLSNRRISTSP
eukprot:Nk52_evm99s208 gene=Nk52_evmTU99s208